MRSRGASLRGEAALEGTVDPPFDGRRCFAHHFRDFRDDEELRAIEHPLLAEREALRLREEREALEDVGYVVDRTAAHLVRVVLEAAFPVLVVIDLAVAEETKEALNVFIADGAPKSDAVDVCYGYE